MKGGIISGLFGVIALACVSCTERTAITGDEFARVARGQGFTVERRVGEQDGEIGISAKWFAIDSINPTNEIMFFEFTGEAAAQNAFDMFREHHTNHADASAITYGSPNDSGVFGNTQEFFLYTIPISERVSLIRVAHTLAYAWIKQPDNPDAQELFTAIGYEEEWDE